MRYRQPLYIPVHSTLWVNFAGLGQRGAANTSMVGDGCKATPLANNTGSWGMTVVVEEQLSISGQTGGRIWFQRLSPLRRAPAPRQRMWLCLKGGKDGGTTHQANATNELRGDGVGIVGQSALGEAELPRWGLRVGHLLEISLLRNEMAANIRVKMDSLMNDSRWLTKTAIVGAAVGLSVYLLYQQQAWPVEATQQTFERAKRRLFNKTRAESISDGWSLVDEEEQDVILRDETGDNGLEPESVGPLQTHHEANR